MNKQLLFGCVVALVASVVSAGTAEDVLRTVNDRLAREFISHDGLLLDYVGEIPTPEEIAELKPNAMGWWCPIENGSMFTGEWLPALMREGVSRKALVETCVKGLIKMSEVSDVPGFIARGTGTDGKSHHPCGSNDQTDPWFLGLCEYCRWPHADPALKAKALERLVFVARALEANNWGVPCDGAFKGQNRGNLNSKAMPFWGKTRLLYSLKSLHRLTGDRHWGDAYAALKETALDGIETGAEVDAKKFKPCYGAGVWIYLSSAQALARLIAMEENPQDRARMQKGLSHYAARVAPLMKNRVKYENTCERPFKYANWRTGYAWRVQKTQKEAEAVAGSGKREILGTRKEYERNGMANPLCAAAVCALSGEAKYRDEILATLRHYDYSTPNICEFFHAAIAAAALDANAEEGAAAVFATSSPSAFSADYDVAVVGGGPAGLGAALSAVRTGAKTVLVERDARIGGTTVSAEVLPIGLFHAWNRQVIAGPAWDLVTNVVCLAGDRLPDFPSLRAEDWWHHCVRVNPVVYAALAAETLEKAGVELRMNTAACGMTRVSDGWRVMLATDEGLKSLTARVVVDATGNGAVAAFAGAERARSSDADRQPGSFFFYLNTKDMKFDAEAVDRAHAVAVKSGELLKTDIHIRMSDYIRNGGGWGCYVPLADNSTASARAETNRRGRETMLRVLRFVQRQKGLEKASLVGSAPEVGVRETYRVVGEKTVTEEAYLAGTIEEDSLCYSYWYIDAHSIDTTKHRYVYHKPGKVGAIPLGAMLPKNVPNLLVAGRAVSSDHGANSALRVQASCMAIGQSAGVVAALAAKRGIDPREVPVPDARKALTSLGAIVPKSN